MTTKGSWQRPYVKKKFNENYDQIFKTTCQSCGSKRVEEQPVMTEVFGAAPIYYNCIDCGAEWFSDDK